MGSEVLTEQEISPGVQQPPCNAASGFSGPDRPMWDDYSHCIRCGLCLNQCPTYRELGLEMDSPRGRIYQMVQVDQGRLPLGESFVRHIDQCLDCRGCETACPSGVEYGKLVEAARAQIELHYRRPLRERIARSLAFRHLLPKPASLRLAGFVLRLLQSSGLPEMARQSGLFKALPRLGELDQLAPRIESPTFFPQIGKVFPARGAKRFRVAFHAGCITNLAFARLQEATVRVLQENGCEVVIPRGQICCGALHVHSGLRDFARDLARRNVAAFDAAADGGFDTILTNAAGCGSTLKDYGRLLESDAAWAEKSAAFAGKMRDVIEFLADVGLVQELRPVNERVTYQDSCHLAHGQKVREQPRKLLGAVPGLRLIEMPLSDICCGSAGIYNVTETKLAMQLLRSKMDSVNSTGAGIIATANPGCILQLRAGVKLYGKSQRVMHVVELLDAASGPHK